VQDALRKIAQRINFAWLEQAARGLDELAQMVRRNIQKVSALDALVVNLRNSAVRLNA
jgi:hypothetical protein